MLSWLRSLPTADSLGDFLADRYGLNVRSCVLLRSLANEVYEVVTDSGRFAFKLYRSGGWSLEEVSWEQELIEHAIRNGIPCAVPVPLPDGSLAAELDAPEGPRPFALSAFVEGPKPQPPFTDDLFRDFGRLIGEFHRVGARFSTERPRRPFDLENVLEEPLREILPLLGKRRTRVAELADYAREQVNAHPMVWGIRHGDVSLDNIHCTDRGLVLHDFDLAGPGWLAADLTGVHSTDHWEAFAAGYRTVAELPDPDALPALTICGLISNLRFHLVQKPGYRGTESVSEGWADRELTAIEQLYAQLF